MKTKFLLSVLLFFTSLQLKAQTSTSNFEFPNVPLIGYWDGADFSGGFQSGSGYFRNSYDTSFGFGFWSTGFAWSTLTDSITSGFTNQMSAKAAGGHNSPGYGIGLQNAMVVLNNGAAAQPISVRLSNSTYAYNSMRDGDTFAKKFGGITGNDPDFFKLVIKAYSGGNLLNDSVEFYLADFRFSNNSLDYLVSTWDSVDLSSLPVCDSLKFVLSSSDTGAFGMNTPAYFCLDDLVIGTNPNKIENKNHPASLQIFPNPSNGSTLYLKSLSNELQHYFIYNNLGKLLQQGSFLDHENIGIHHLSKGIYYLHFQSEQGIQIIQWVKQ
jgi:hypothetical protein